MCKCVEYEEFVKNPNPKVFWSLLCIMTLFYLKDKKEINIWALSIIYIYIYIFHDGDFWFFFFLSHLCLFGFLSFFTIAHMFRWMVSWKIERDVMMSKRKEWILGLRKSRVENLALLFGGKLRHNSQDKNRQNFWWMEGCMFCTTS
jgi:hypothetical protein